MRYPLFAMALVAEAVTAYPFVADLPGVDSSLFRKRQQPGGFQKGGAATCPFNPNHVPAAPVTAQYPYNGAINGLPGKGIGGYQVPAPGDTAHQFVAPGPNDIRKSCHSLIKYPNTTRSLTLTRRTLPRSKRSSQPQLPRSRRHHNL
jgi:hypothetical protein